jgi:hypothetical protein
MVERRAPLAVAAMQALLGLVVAAVVMPRAIAMTKSIAQRTLATAGVARTSSRLAFAGRRKSVI